MNIYELLSAAVSVRAERARNVDFNFQPRGVNQSSRTSTCQSTGAGLIVDADDVGNPIFSFSTQRVNSGPESDPISRWLPFPMRCPARGDDGDPG